MVLIDAARDGTLDLLLTGRDLCIADSVRDEVRYWRDADGLKHNINLQSYLDSGSLSLISATTQELADLLTLVSSRTLGAGELESLALVRARGFRFCTADRAAKHAMQVIGCLDRWMSLAELARQTPAFDVRDPKYQ